MLGLVGCLMSLMPLPGVVLVGPALADPITNPNDQMKRQRQLVNQTSPYGLTREQELRQERAAEIQMDRALQDYNNSLDLELSASVLRLW